MLNFFQKKKIRKLLFLIVIASFVGAIFCSIFLYRYKIRTTMNNSQIFVCDNPTHHSDFDKWILNDCDVDWVPSYIIIKNDKVIGTIDGNIPEREFTDLLGTIVINDFQLCDLPEFEITNLEGNSYTLQELTPNKESFYILEVSWATCEDCKQQDKLYTKDIYFKYSTNNFIRYYINSEQNEVLNYKY